MPKKKRPEERPSEQFERFIETARTHGVEDGREAEEKFKSITKRQAPGAKKDQG